MRREVLVAIILGVGLGIAVAFGIWRANLALSPQKSPSPIVDNTNDSQDKNVSDLIITQPENNLVVSEEELLVKGSTTPRATVVILTPADEDIVQADSDGSFEKQIDVAGGPNDIVVKAYDSQGNESQQKVTIVYSTEISEDN